MPCAKDSNIFCVTRVNIGTRFFYSQDKVIVNSAIDMKRLGTVPMVTIDDKADVLLFADLTFLGPSSMLNITLNLRAICIGE